MSEFAPARWSGSGKKSVQAVHSASPPDPPAETPTSYAGPDATDAAKALAAQHDINLASVVGTGTEGRITKDDVQGVADQATEPGPQAKGGDDAEPDQADVALTETDSPSG